MLRGKVPLVLPVCRARLTWDPVQRTLGLGLGTAQSHTMAALYAGNMNKLQVGVHSNARSFETLPLERKGEKKPGC